VSLRKAQIKDAAKFCGLLSFPYAMANHQRAHAVGNGEGVR
jgi:hypothetical protein